MSRVLPPFFKLLTIGLLIAICVISLVPAGYRPETSASHDLEHFGVFALFGAALVLGYRPRIWVCVALALLFAGLVELAQIGIPSRHARLSDFLIDAAGSLLGSICAVLLLQAYHALKHRETTSPHDKIKR